MVKVAVLRQMVLGMEQLAAAEAEPQDSIPLVLLEPGQGIRQARQLALFLMPLAGSLGELGDGMLQPGPVVLDIGDAPFADFDEAPDLALDRAGKGVVLPGGQAEPGAETGLELIQVGASGRLGEQRAFGPAVQGRIVIEPCGIRGIEGEASLHRADHRRIASSARFARSLAERFP